MSNFSSSVLRWFKTHGRHNLPWQKNVSSYRVWVSEIMLQQTQVKTVVPYFERFMKRFPEVDDLSSATTDQVLHLWTGLGYYARARNLHKTARIITSEHDSLFPRTVDELLLLPGIGRSTAGAILALSMNERAPILDGNVKRVLARFYSIQGWPEQKKVKEQLWEIAEQNTPLKDFSQYTQAVMDLGATVCKRSNPDCLKCPLNSACSAYKHNEIRNYPGKKPKKPIPVKKVRMYVFENELGEFLLEQRPPKGIWGSLYSFPEELELNKLKKNIETSNIVRLESASAEESNLQPIRHTFSHFQLEIQPKLLKVLKNEFVTNDSIHWVWYSFQNPVELGLAAPVKKLLSTLSARKLEEKKAYE